jgi:hypothetical protein
VDGLAGLNREGIIVGLDHAFSPFKEGTDGITARRMRTAPGGHFRTVEVNEGTTVAQFLSDRLPNRAATDQLLQANDRDGSGVSF